MGEFISEVMGSVGSFFNEDFKEVGVTYFIAAKHRGHGYAAQALSTLVEYIQNYSSEI